jgi:site-specific DNA-cytosine methylase
MFSRSFLEHANNEAFFLFGKREEKRVHQSGKKKGEKKPHRKKKRKQERMREPSSRKLGRTNQVKFESELAREIRGVLFACPHFFLLDEKRFVKDELVFLIENAMMYSSSWELLREYVNYEKREIQIEKMEKEKRVRVVFEGKKQSADEQPSLKVVVLISGGGRVCSAAKTGEVRVKTTMTWNRDDSSDAMEVDSRNSSSLSMRQQYNIARSIVVKNQNISRKSIEIKFRDVLKRLRDERDCDRQRRNGEIKMENLAMHTDSMKMKLYPGRPIGCIRDETFQNWSFQVGKPFYFISLFSGAGIAVEGLRSAGGFPVLICEKDSRRMEQLKLNNLDLEPWQFIEDVFTIDQTLIDRVVNKYFHVDLIDASPECKPHSPKNVNRANVPTEIVFAPIEKIFEIEKYVVLAQKNRLNRLPRHLKVKEMKANRSTLVMIENVPGILQQRTVDDGERKIAHIVEVMRICVRQSMGFGIRTLHAEDAGLDASKTRVFLLATRNRHFDIEECLNFHTRTECKGECRYVYGSCQSKCYRCLNRSRLKSEKTVDVMDNNLDSNLDSQRFTCQNLQNFNSVHLDGTTLTNGITATNSTRIIVVNKTGALPVRWLGLKDLSRLFGVDSQFFTRAPPTLPTKKRARFSMSNNTDEVSNGAFVDASNDDFDAQAKRFMKMIGDSATAPLLRFLGSRIKRSLNIQNQTTSRISRRVEFLDETSRQDWVNKLLSAKDAYPSDYGVSLSASVYDDFDEIDDVDAILTRGLKRTKDKLSVPLFAISETTPSQRSSLKTSNHVVPEEVLSKYREKLRREIDAGLLLKIDFNTRRSLGFSNDDAFKALLFLVKKAPKKARVLFHQPTAESLYSIPFVRINGTNYELGDAICRSSVDALMDDEKTISSSSEFKRLKEYLKEQTKLLPTVKEKEWEEMKRALTRLREAQKQALILFHDVIK